MMPLSWNYFSKDRQCNFDASRSLYCISDLFENRRTANPRPLRKSFSIALRARNDLETVKGTTVVNRKVYGSQSLPGHHVNFPKRRQRVRASLVIGL